MSCVSMGVGADGNLAKFPSCVLLCNVMYCMYEVSYSSSSVSDICVFAQIYTLRILFCIHVLFFRSDVHFMRKQEHLRR